MWPGTRPQAAEFVPVDGVDSKDLADAAQLSSLADETPEGRSVVILAKNEFGLREREPGLMTGVAERVAAQPAAPWG
jgi:potassium-transporting ATPase ATP-binding subunit